MITNSTPTGSVGMPVLRGQTLRHALIAGARVLTGAGERPIEALAVGDRVITRDFGMVPIRAVHRSDVPAGTPLVLIPAGSLGAGKPERDLRLLPDQPVALRGWRARAVFKAHEARVAAARLVDGTVIRTVESDGAAAVSLILDMPAAIYSDGLEVITAAVDAVAPR